MYIRICIYSAFTSRSSPVLNKHNLMRHAKTQVHFLSHVMVTVQYFSQKSTRHEHAENDKWFHKDFISSKHTFDAHVCKYFKLIHIEKKNVYYNNKYPVFRH